MADRHVPNKDLKLDVWFHYDWHAEDAAHTVYGAAMQAIEETIVRAQRLAVDFVKPGGGGPGPHPHISDVEPEFGEGLVKHGFEWKDTGKLSQAIHIRRGYKKMPWGYAGSPTASLYVEPITVVSKSGDGRKGGRARRVNYGAFLEMGFVSKTPVPVYVTQGKKKKKVRITQMREGKYTIRYPFLAPSMYRATEKFEQTLRITVARELSDLSRRNEKKQKRLVRERLDREGIMDRVRTTRRRLDGYKLPKTDLSLEQN